MSNSKPYHEPRDHNEGRKPTVDDMLYQRRGRAALHDEPDRMQASSGPAPPTRRGSDDVGYASHSVTDGESLLAAWNRTLAMCSGYADIAQDYEGSATSGDPNYGSGTPFSLQLFDFRANMRALLQEISDRFETKKVKVWAAYHTDTLPPGEATSDDVTQQRVADFYDISQVTASRYVNEIDDFVEDQLKQGALEP
jgi:hypothetical protein